jgi:hypothetical protein
MRDLARLPETRSKRSGILRLRPVRKQPGETCGRFGAEKHAPSAERGMFAAINTQFGK